MLKYLIMPCLCLAPAFAAAQSVQDSIISQLHDQGYTRIEVSRTLLGRTRVEATSDRLQREMVFNPQTGEILRDYWQERDDSGRVTPQIMDPQARNEDDRDKSGRGSDDSRSSDDRDGASRGDDSKGSGSHGGGSDDSGGRGDNSGKGGDSSGKGGDDGGGRGGDDGGHDSGGDSSGGEGQDD